MRSLFTGRGAGAGDGASFLNSVEGVGEGEFSSAETTTNPSSEFILVVCSFLFVLIQSKLSLTKFC